jgi:lysophospholipase L1-like esterase
MANNIKTDFISDIIDNVSKDRPYPVVFYGASTTSAEYAMPNWGEILRFWLKKKITKIVGNYKKAFWNIQTANRGIDGGSSSDLLERWPALVLDLAPKLLILSVGKNDFYYGIDREITRKNTREIIKKSLEAGMKIIFMTTVPALTDKLNQGVKDYIAVDREVAKEFSVKENFVFVDLFESFAKADLEKIYTLISENGNKDIGIGPGEVDPVHYNRLGNAMVAKIILENVFDMDFDVERFMQDLNNPTKKYPGL